MNPPASEGPGHPHEPPVKNLDIGEQLADDSDRFAGKVGLRPATELAKLAAEVRQQLNLQLSISRTLIDLKVVREFQQSVIEVSSEVDPSVARQIVAKLKERRALRASGTLPALDGGFDVA